MLRGKRRYTPIPRCFRGKKTHKTTVRRTIPKNRNLRQTRQFPPTKTMPKTTTKKETVILKRETVFKNGKMYVRVVKAFAPKKSIKDDSDYLQ